MKSFWRGCIKFYRNTDKLLMSLCLICSAVSVYMLLGIQAAGFIRPRVFATQMIATLIGIAVACFVSFFDYRFVAKLWKLYLPFAYGLVLLTFFIGRQRYSYIDDKAWLEIPFIGMTIQPSEILKLAFIYSFALHLEKVKEHINNPQTLMLLGIHGAIPTLMI
ncbi:MAG: FtsW/RodA/SpoVE family cell cycle protein, partial [Oscillospiraceae bacterium]|nr:FtsW/RodA/SpoVE family cell cycle protein [Oscillospiraceae bacterium]